MRSVQTPEQPCEKMFGRPAKLPHSVMSKIMVWGPKKCVELQVEEGQNADGMPQLEGLGELPVKSEGIEARGKNHVEMPSEFHCAAKAPPPLDAKPAP